MINNEFIDVPGYAGYQVNLNQQVKRLSRVIAGNGGCRYLLPEKILKHNTDGGGYSVIDITEFGKRKRGAIHRLMALAFLPNPNNKKYINHKNGIKSDNRIENLEWCTSAENHKHAYDTGLKKKPFRNINALKGEKSPMYGRRGELSHVTKWLLDTQTGIFYAGAEEAAKAKNTNLNCLRRKLWGGRPNNTSLIYV